MTLYIIHGWTYTVEPWTKTLQKLRQSGITVKMLHVPGLTEPSRKVWTIQDYVKWADRNLPDGAIALGHSNGGRILLNLCAERPDKLSHLILLDSAGIYEVHAKQQFVKKLAKLGAPLKRIKSLRKVFHKLSGTTDYAKAPANMKQTLTNMLESDKSLDLSRVTTPTSILWGREDTVTPVHQAEMIHQQIQGSSLQVYDNWRHAPYITHPGELVTAIIQTLKTIASSKPSSSPKPKGTK